MQPDKQIAFVTDLNKCIGCQTCTVACKKMWTSGDGQDFEYWMNVETHPGKGYPKDWQKKGGGFKDGKLQIGLLPTLEDYGIPFQFDYTGRLFEGKPGPVTPSPEAKWGPNWDEDTGAGMYPNTYYFYLPRMCNHCTDPACLTACPSVAIYKRKEDGIVVVNQDLCSGQLECVKACPYGAIFFNPTTKVAEKCIGCFPMLEKGKAPICVGSCVGRARFVGYLDDMNSAVGKLIHKWKVALPLHSEFGTQPNEYFIPPVSPYKESKEGEITSERRIPDSLLKEMFGPRAIEVLDIIEMEREKRRKGQRSELMDLLIAHTNREMISI
ncbi:MAG: respiratory nitrate reductase subunit beta [Bacteroidetes bacterium]|nr:respiratory nitrate reductase subunit beta [Bacteroidota bacterium]